MMGLYPRKLNAINKMKWLLAHDRDALDQNSHLTVSIIWSTYKFPINSPAWLSDWQTTSNRIVGGSTVSV
jgi:hypothetical protein